MEHAVGLVRSPTAVYNEVLEIDNGKQRMKNVRDSNFRV